MPISGRYREGLLRQQLQQEERAVTPGLSCSAAHPSLPPAASRLCHDCPQYSTTQGSHRNGDSCVPSSTRAIGTAQTKLLVDPQPKSWPHCIKWECANDSHKAKLHPLLRLWSVSSLDSLPTPHWYMQAAGTCTYSVSCVTQTASICVFHSEQFPEVGRYFKILFPVELYFKINPYF